MAKRVSLTTEDGLRLDARWHEGGDRAVVRAHGLSVDLEENGLFAPLAATLVERGLPTARALYGTRTSGDHDLEGRFVLGAPLFEEFAQLSPVDAFLATTQPALVIHGDADSHVSHDIARDAARQRQHTDWLSIPGAEHGFLDPEASTVVIETTADWLERQV